MYDPEFEIMIQEGFIQLRQLTELVREKAGSDSPITKLCEGIDRAMECIEEKRQEYENCFDDRKEGLLIELNGMIMTLHDITNKFQKMLNPGV